MLCNKTQIEVRVHNDKMKIVKHDWKIIKKVLTSGCRSKGYNGGY